MTQYLKTQDPFGSRPIPNLFDLLRWSGFCARERKGGTTTFRSEKTEKSKKQKCVLPLFDFVCEKVGFLFRGLFGVLGELEALVIFSPFDISDSSFLFMWT